MQNEKKISTVSFLICITKYYSTVKSELHPTQLFNVSIYGLQGGGVVSEKVHTEKLIYRRHLKVSNS